MQARVRLLAIERQRRIGGEEIRIARDEIVAGVASVEVGMHREIPRADIEQRAALETAVHGRGRSLELCLPAPDRRRERNPVVGRLHDAAHRLRAETQRVRPAVDLDLLHRERIERDAMVLAEVGHVHGADAVLLDAHTEVVEPAQHGARCTRREAGRRRARHGEEQVAEALGLGRLDLGAGNGVERRRGLDQRSGWRQWLRGARRCCG
jgi:hypothetical protein